MSCCALAGRSRRHTIVRIFAVIITGLSIALVGGAAPAAAAPLTGIIVGNNIWAGAIDAGRGFTAVEGTVVVPRVDALCGTNSNVAIWVGLGGYLGMPFAQNGISVTPRGRSAWYELFDRNGNGPVVSVPLAMSSGDQVRLSLAFSAGHGTLTFVWRNLTRHVQTQRVIGNAARWYNGGTAEWIVERANYDPPTSSPALAHFSPVTFTGALASVGPAQRAALPDTYTSLMWGVGLLRQLTGLSPAPRARDSFTTTWRACR